MVEAVISTVIVAVMLGTAMSVVRMSGQVQYRAADRSRGAALADGLMWEIMQQSYEDATGPVLFGHELAEANTNRSTCNDVDDYSGWSETPPQNRDGTTISNMTGWSRAVTVTWVSASNIANTSLIESGAKRIVVTVKHNGMTIATRTAVRTKAP